MDDTYPEPNEAELLRFSEDDMGSWDEVEGAPYCEEYGFIFNVKRFATNYSAARSEPLAWMYI